MGCASPLSCEARRVRLPQGQEQGPEGRRVGREGAPGWGRLAVRVSHMSSPAIGTTAHSDASCLVGPKARILVPAHRQDRCQ
eukprot:9484768-Alexandrium_andersonii.AAC.1